LIVIDFIDMEDRRNNRKVEQRLRDALSNDRARIQVGRISSFGLLELSRQRMNPSLAEAQQEVCAHCAGTGRVKTLDFSAISIIRALEVEGIRGKANEITITMATSVALYVMNHKRKLLNDLESRYGFSVLIETDDTMSTSHYKLEAATRAVAPKPAEGIRSVAMDDFDESMEDDAGEETETEETEEGSEARAPREDRGDRDGARRRRGRRGGRNRRGRERDAGEDDSQPNVDPEGNRIREENNEDDSIGNRVEGGEEDADGNSENNREGGNGRRRRGRRGGRGRGRGERGERGNDNGASNPQFRDAPGEPLLQESKPPRVDTHVHVQAPIQMVSTGTSARAPVSEPSPPRDYEKVNQAPEKKKKGWWNKLVE
jgi:ribonuclease E